jgi:hypothetical protein
MTFGGFVRMTASEVEAEAIRVHKLSPAGTTWMGLSNLMQRQGYKVIGELGLAAAGAWATHLGVAVEDATLPRVSADTGAPSTSRAFRSAN